jgi:hypothetical protein
MGIQITKEFKLPHFEMDPFRMDKNMFWSIMDRWLEPLD